VSGRTLFSEGELRKQLDEARRKAVDTLLRYDPDEMLRAAETDIVDYLIGLGTVHELVLHRDDTSQLEPLEVKKFGSEQWNFRIEASELRVTRYTFVVPFSGDPRLFGLRASSWTTAAPWAEVDQQELHLHWDSDRGTATADLIKGHLDARLDRIQQYINFTNVDIAQHNKAIKDLIPAQVAARRAKHLTDMQLQADLGYRIRRRSDAAAYAVPLNRRLIAPARRRPAQSPAGSRTFAPEPVLVEANYEAALKVLFNARNALERSPSLAAKANEAQIRDLLLVFLNGHFEGNAAGEVFNGAGKTDILIRVDDKNVFIGECKIWHGSKAFADAIDQLLGYTVWRDCKAALLLFIRSGDVTSITEKAIATVRAHPNYKRDGIHATEDRHDFVVHADGDPAREIHLALLPFLVRAKTS
jgi:hypothetical protein